MTVSMLFQNYLPRYHGYRIDVLLPDLIQFIPDSVHLSGISANVYNICASITKPSIVDPQANIQLSLKNFKECKFLSIIYTSCIMCVHEI